MENATKLEEVKQAMRKARDRRMYERCLAISLHLQGHSVKEIAHTLNRSTQTVTTYIKAYDQSGLPGLQMNHSPGAPVRLSDEQLEQLKQTIAYCVPHEVGFIARHTCTLELIAAFIEREFGQSYSLRGVSKMMHRQGLSYTKPTYTLAAADEEKQRQFSETTFPESKKDAW
ncbi:winged helix-turn-helix domain-containing protein [Paenibacillus sp. MER TA 81-3]|uniref:helix-turn-helix domain-containing protein n=1 Tax=Paenibacillus sp. MER TA 81-3 TaxID=2939573 RepID=UPI00204005F0|nr:winged helix-turn-helix domain-containing protein [Paenibacillus sp. MER TA 81-3]MCM3339947.1 winged helix-turn-helix domain-containing protein [Paenibacillus sp. MER TA 81-3]